MQNTIGRQSVWFTGLGIDTAVVLFFLAIEFTRSVQLSSVDTLLMGITTVMIMVLPYFLPSNMSELSFSTWLAGRAFVGLAGLVAGYGLQQTEGFLISGSFGSLPMTFLILAGMTSCHLQFYGLMKLRLAK